MERVNSMKTELKNTKLLLKETQEKHELLTKAIWDILNYANIFIVLIDSTMTIKLANWSLATKLGFEDEKGLIGKDWLQCVKVEDRRMIKGVHKTLLKHNEDSKKYTEFTNDIVLPDNKLLPVKWFNIPINSSYNLVFSIGIHKQITYEENEDSIRSYYRDVIETDKSMIKSIKETFVKNIEDFDSTCSFILNDGKEG